jgi:hypothetical protein
MTYFIDAREIGSKDEVEDAFIRCDDVCQDCLEEISYVARAIGGDHARILDQEVEHIGARLQPALRILEKLMVVLERGEPAVVDHAPRSTARSRRLGWSMARMEEVKDMRTMRIDGEDDATGARRFAREIEVVRDRPPNALSDAIEHGDIRRRQGDPRRDRLRCLWQRGGVLRPGGLDQGGGHWASRGGIVKVRRGFAAGRIHRKMKWALAGLEEQQGPSETGLDTTTMEVCGDKPRS